MTRRSASSSPTLRRALEAHQRRRLFSQDPRTSAPPEDDLASGAPDHLPETEKSTRPEELELVRRISGSLGRLWVVPLIVLLLLIPETGRGQIQWMNFEDGDILNVSSASGMEPGHFQLEVDRARETSLERGELLAHRFKFEYGLTSNLVLGSSVVHLQQRREDLFKDGMGDSNLFLKAFVQPYKDRPIFIGLRQSLSIPTGYEPERDELAAFTSRKNDYSAQILLSYRKANVEAHLNPGVILPGGDRASYLTAGGGLVLHRFLPLGIGVRTEYFTRWNMVEREFESDVFVALDRQLFWGVSIEGGFKRRLLQDEGIDPEIRFGLSLGRAHRAQADVYRLEPRIRGPVNLILTPIESAVPDPHGLRADLTREVRIAHQKTRSRLVYLSTVPEGERAQVHQNARSYQMRLKLLEINAGEVSGTKIPMLLKAPRAKARVVAQLEIVSPDGISAARTTVLRAEASKGLGAELVPTTTEIESMVVSDEVKQTLLRKAMRDLAGQILRNALEVIQEREAQ